MSQQINLFNPVFLQQKKYFSALAMLQALGLILLGTMFFYGYASYQVGAMSGQMQEMGKRLQAEQSRLASFSAEYSPQKASQLLDEELNRLEAQARVQEANLAALKSGAIGNTDGYSDYMRAFARQSVTGLWLTGFEIVGDGKHMSLQGVMLDPQLLPSYIQRLGGERVMRGKTFAAIQMQRKKEETDRLSNQIEFVLQSQPLEEGKR